MKFKVGDKVKIRSDLVIGEYGCDSVVEEMLAYLGIEDVVEEIKHYNWGSVYRLEYAPYNWTDEMLEDSYDTLKDFLKGLKI